MNLFELAQAYDELRRRDDLDTETLTDTLDSIHDTAKVKLDNLASWHDDNTAKIELLTKRKMELGDEISRLKRLNEHLMDYMTSSMDNLGYKELVTDRHVLKPRNFRQKTVIDETVLPEQYWKTKTTTTPDRTAVYRALKNGESVDGAHLEPNRKTVIK